MEHDTLRQAQAQTLPLQSANFRALQLTPTLVLISSETSPWTLEQTAIWSCTVQLSRYLSWIKGLIWLFIILCVCRSSVAGAEAYFRYKNLISEDNIPFVRASSSERVVNSATNWTYGDPTPISIIAMILYWSKSIGFSAANSLTFNPVLSVILSESVSSLCPSCRLPISQPSGQRYSRKFLQWYWFIW